MANKTMHHQIIGDDTYEIVDQSARNDLDTISPVVNIPETLTINSTDFTFIGNKTIGSDGTIYDNESYRAYYYQYNQSGTFSMNNFGYSSYGFVALFNGTPSNGTFVERKYTGTQATDITPFAVTAGQSVFISVNLISTISFNTYLTVSNSSRPNLFIHDEKIVWLGDSLSQLQSLPERVAEYMACTVYDCSFAGAALTYGSTLYGGTSVLSLSGQIASGSFTALDTALDNQESDGIDVTEKRVHATTLKGLNFSNITHIVIMAGTNDLNNDYVTTSSDLTAFKNGVQDIIDNLNTAYPGIRLYFIAEPYRGDITPSNPDRYGHSIEDINDAIEEICLANNIAFFDLYHNCGINANTEGYYLLTDKLHQTVQGDILIAEKSAKWLNAN